MQRASSRGEGEAILGALGLIFIQRPIIITEGHGGKLGEGNNDERVRQELGSLGYNRSLTVPEVCGFVQTCRNTIWWPDEETEAAAMAIIGKDIEKHTSSPLPMFDLYFQIRICSIKLFALSNMLDDDIYSTGQYIATNNKHH